MKEKHNRLTIGVLCLIILVSGFAAYFSGIYNNIGITVSMAQLIIILSLVSIILYQSHIIRKYKDNAEKYESISNQN